VICDQWDVVAVPFPFTDQQGSKRRPALVLSIRDFNACGHSVMAMITTQHHRAWPGDTVIQDREAAGLPLPCVVRLKLFTLDARLIIRKLGSLEAQDRSKVQEALSTFLT
jgi:mRNA interferase MazF